MCEEEDDDDDEDAQCFATLNKEDVDHVNQIVMKPKMAQSKFIKRQTNFKEEKSQDLHDQILKLLSRTEYKQYEQLKKLESAKWFIEVG